MPELTSDLMPFGALVGLLALIGFAYWISYLWHRPSRGGGAPSSPPATERPKGDGSRPPSIP